MNNAGLTTYPEIYMPCPFAGEADAGGTSGTNRSKDFSDAKSAANVNMRTGFPTVFTLAQSSNGKYLSRPDMNQLGYMATVGQYRKQIGCLNEFNAAFASKIQGYAKGAVLDYVVYHDQTNHLVSEVWKIVSLVDKNSTAPTSSNILSFGTDSSTAGAGDKLWMRIVPDKAYIETIQSECHTYADGIVATEKARAEGIEATKINTTTANGRYANGGNQTEGCLDGTARDADGKPVLSQHTAATAVAAGITVQTASGKQFIAPGWNDTKTGSGSSVLNVNTNLAVSGHVHTNIYTKDEVDAKIGAMGGMYANGKSQKDGYSDGTYSVSVIGGATSYYGHMHTDYCANSASESHGESSHNGTYTEVQLGGVTHKYGHIHTDLAKASDVYTKSESNSYFARGGSQNGTLDCTAKNSSSSIVVPTFSGTPARGSYSGVSTGHYHTNYATTEYVDEKISGAGSGTIYVTEQWHSGYSWYRKWSNGFCEQGGNERIEASQVFKVVTVNLHVPFSSTEYTLLLTASSHSISTDNNHVINEVEEERTSSSFAFEVDDYNGSSKSSNNNWVAFGYIAS